MNVHTKPVFKLQDKAMRIISFAEFHAPCDPLYYKLKVLKLADMVKLLNIIFTKSSLQQTSPSCFHNYFTYVRDSHGYNTTNASLRCLFVTSIETNKYGLHSITRKCISEWNHTMLSITNKIPELPFGELKKFLTNTYLESYVLSE